MFKFNGWVLMQFFVIWSTDEWKNFLQRVNCSNEDELKEYDELEEELRRWASYRGQTLTRTGFFTLFLCLYET
jgi:hypothetical protein